MKKSILCAMPCDDCSKLLNRWPLAITFAEYAREEVQRIEHGKIKTGKYMLASEETLNAIRPQILSVGWQSQYITQILFVPQMPLHVKIRALQQYPEIKNHPRLNRLALHTDTNVIGNLSQMLYEGAAPNLSAQDYIELMLAYPELNPDLSMDGDIMLDSAYFHALLYLSTIPEYPHLLSMWQDFPALRHVLNDNPSIALEQLARPELFAQEGERR